MAEIGLKGSLSRYLTSGGLIAKYLSLDFDPSQPPGAIVRDGVRKLNIYTPPPADAAPGDVTGFLFLMNHLFPEPTDQSHVFSWLAHLVQHPGVKILHALLIRSEAHGVGKGTLTDLARALVGEGNSVAIGGDRLADRFNGWQAGKLLVIADETSEAGGWQFSNSLKRLITESDITIEAKGQNAMSLPNRANYIITTNREGALKLEAPDRRYYVVDSAAEPLPADHFTRQHGWWRDILPAIRHYLLNEVDLSKWLPTAPPPTSAAKLEMISASRSDLEVEIERLCEIRAGAFAGDLATVEEVRDSLPDRLRLVAVARIRSAMRVLGMRPVGDQTRVDGGWRFTAGHRHWREGAQRPRLWCLRHAGYWEGAPPSSLAREYARSTSTMVEWLDAMAFPEATGQLTAPLGVWTPDLGQWGPNELLAAMR
jgi:hypothetical protein